MATWSGKLPEESMDEYGFLSLPSADDVPIHSTPIKGSKVPLPSTKPLAVERRMHSKSATDRNQLQPQNAMGPHSIQSNDSLTVCAADSTPPNSIKKPTMISPPSKRRPQKYLHAVDNQSQNSSPGSKVTVLSSTLKGSPRRQRSDSPSHTQTVFVTATTKFKENESLQGSRDDSFFGIGTKSSMNKDKAASRFEKSKQLNVSGGDATIKQKQRQEIQLLIGELKDRDRELTDMMSAHQQQLMAWEQDRQRLLSMEQKCAELEAEVQNKSKQLQEAATVLKSAKHNQLSHSSAMEQAREQISKLKKENQALQEKIGLLQDKNHQMSENMREASVIAGKLQAKEEELAAIVKMKEKDMSFATSQMRDLSDRLKQLDRRSKECQDREKEALKEANEYKQKHTTGRKELERLSGELQKKSNELNQLVEEVQIIKQQHRTREQEFRERERYKDELIDSLKAKQERTDAQLKNLRQLYERQQNDVANLQMNLDISKDVIRKQQTSLEDQSSLRNSSSYSKSASRISSDPSQSYSPGSRPGSLGVRPSPVVRTRDSEGENFYQHTQTSGYQSAVLELISQDQSGALNSDTRNSGTDRGYDGRELPRNSYHGNGSQEVRSSQEMRSGQVNDPDRHVKIVGRENYMYSREREIPGNEYHGNTERELRDSVVASNSDGQLGKDLRGHSYYSNQDQESGYSRLKVTVDTQYAKDDSRSEYSESNRTKSENNRTENENERTESEPHERKKHEGFVYVGFGYKNKDYGKDLLDETEKKLLEKLSGSDTGHFTTESQGSHNIAQGTFHNGGGAARGQDERLPGNSSHSDRNHEVRDRPMVRHIVKFAEENLNDVRKSLDFEETNEQRKHSGKPDERLRDVGQEISDRNPVNEDRFITPPRVDENNERFITPPRADEQYLKGTSSSRVREEVKKREPLIEQRVSFEDRLTSFLEDIDEIDDSIWDNDKTMASVSEVEASPASKLQKLLLESRMMIENLEKSASPETRLQNMTERVNIPKVPTQPSAGVKLDSLPSTSGSHPAPNS